MSIVELLAVLYGKVMRYKPEDPRWEDRDWLVLSRVMRACPVCNPGLEGLFPVRDAEDPEPRRHQSAQSRRSQQDPGVDMTTGSLGQGMSTGWGCLGPEDGRTAEPRYIVLGDGRAKKARFGKAPYSEAMPNWIT